jgi:RNA polymerase sigma-70 factor (ECF subfamily)
MKQTDQMTREPVTDLGSIVARGASGDLGALGELFERFHDGVYRYAYVRIGNQADADEVAGEVFAQMVRSIKTYTERGPGFAPWLYRIARNVVADHHRRRARHPEEVSAEIPEYPTESLEESIEARERARAIREALSTLPDEQAHLLTLRFAGGLSAEEIGAVMGKSAGAVRIQQMRALQSLRDKIEVAS